MPPTVFVFLALVLQSVNASDFTKVNLFTGTTVLNKP
ncbi:unnamed protein product [Haemonchus placei]|uniref:SERPIN domain-containing protein n=1 Tax=Haemonchus placei TaxID=6290 RepID=A0A0N4W758_HAEPC|nr:unnamed protein product [Haemonchus placei]